MLCIDFDVMVSNDGVSFGVMVRWWCGKVVVFMYYFVLILEVVCCALVFPRGRSVVSGFKSPVWFGMCYCVVL